MIITFSSDFDGVSVERLNHLRANAIQALENAKRAKKERNKKLYKLECAIGWVGVNPLNPFIVALWNFKTPDEMQIVVWKGK